MRAIPARGQQREDRLGRGFVLACVLVLALCMTHQLLMMTEQHAAVMGPLHERVGAGPPVIEMLVVGLPGIMGGPDGHRPQAPPVLGDCPAQQAIVPALLLLFAFLGTLARFRCRRDTPVGWGAWGIVSWLDALRPPPPARRRALLQVFRN